jgi:hypothetical protein
MLKCCVTSNQRCDNLCTINSQVKQHCYVNDCIVTYYVSSWEMTHIMQMFIVNK